MSAAVVGVPSGVGDIYWVLCKLQAIREAAGWSHVTLAIQQTKYNRSHEWADMVDFVDAAQYIALSPNEALRTGYQHGPAPVNCTLWPNAVLDRGEPLRDWLPNYKLNQDFEISLPDMRDVHRGNNVIVYASSTAVSKSWLPRTNPLWWRTLLMTLSSIYGMRPMVIGANWDKENCAELEPYCEMLVGNTTLPAVLALIREARLVIGVASGMTIMANHFRTPCVALFPDKHHAEFPWTWIKDNTPYLPIFNRDIKGASIVAEVGAMLEQNWRHKKALLP